LPARPADLVVVEQPLDLTRPQAGLGPLVTAYLGRRPAQRVGHGLAAAPLGLAQLPQLSREPATAYRGRTLVDHWGTASSTLLPRPAHGHREPRPCRRPDLRSFASWIVQDADLEFFTERFVETRYCRFSPRR